MVLLVENIVFSLIDARITHCGQCVGHTPNAVFDFIVVWEWECVVVPGIKLKLIAQLIWLNINHTWNSGFFII